MLFRTVVGSELEALFHYICLADRPISRKALQETFSTRINHEFTSKQNIDDALSFLLSAHLLEERKEGLRQIDTSPQKSFNLLVLSQLRELSLEKIHAKHVLDHLYLRVLDDVFIAPDRLFVMDVHAQANQSSDITALGGVSKEKIQAWKRVMSFLGVGYRVSGGFQGIYTPQLVLDILMTTTDKQMPLQEFLEDHLARYLPIETGKRELPQAVVQPLFYLENNREIALTSKQDSPYKAYFGDRHIRYIEKV